MSELVLCHHYKVLPTDSRYKNLSSMQRFSLLLFAESERNRLFKTVTDMATSALGVINPAFGKALMDSTGEEGEAQEATSQENVAYESDSLLSDEKGEMIENTDRMALYKEHIELLKRGDPSVRVLGGNSSSFRDPK